MGLFQADELITQGDRQLDQLLGDFRTAAEDKQNNGGQHDRFTSNSFSTS